MAGIKDFKWAAFDPSTGKYGEPHDIGVVNDIHFTEGPNDPYDKTHKINGFEATVSFDWNKDSHTALMREIHEATARERGCATCKHCKQVKRYPGFCTAEECECMVGLKCDTIMHSVKNCKKYEELPFGEPQPHDPILDDPRYMYVL